MDDSLKAFGDKLSAALPGAVTETKFAFGELSLTVARERILEALKFARDDADGQFACFVDITGADYPERERRLEVVYHLLSLTKNHRLRLRVQTDEDTPIASATSVYVGADWFEREAYDLLGVSFEGHPDLRRLLTDYGFEGHPLRKDFPMTGFVEVRYDDEEKRVRNEPVTLNQEFRKFDFLSPWDGPTSTLPGYEKAKTP